MRCSEAVSQYILIKTNTKLKKLFSLNVRKTFAVNVGFVKKKTAAVVVLLWAVVYKDDSDSFPFYSGMSGCHICVRNSFLEPVKRPRSNFLNQKKALNMQCWRCL